MHSKVPPSIDDAARLALCCIRTQNGKCKFFLRLFEEPCDTPSVDQVLEPRFLAVRAVATLRKHAHHRCCDRDQLIRPEQQATVRSELLMTRDSAQQHAEVDARWNTAALANTD